MIFRNNCMYYLKYFTSKRLGLPQICSSRLIFSKSGIWDEPYTKPEVLQEIENHWKEKFKIEDELDLGLQNKSKLDIKSKGKKYILSMFPYPSGELHMGHVRVYTVSDTMARYYRSNGYQVIHPIGWDAFGLPAENAAIEHCMAPSEWTQKNIRRMKEQLQQLGCKFDWWREVCTSDPSYYKWTQELFLKLYNAGLTYKKEAVVNWDPVDETVLADEQVDSEGKAWRSGAKVHKKLLNQWYIRTSRLSKSLYEGLNEPQIQDWRSVINSQKKWIGICDGFTIDFNVKINKATDDSALSRITVYIENPELLHGVSFMGVRQDHLFTNYGTKSQPNKINLTNCDKSILFSLSNVELINPLNKRLIPVVISDDLPFKTNRCEYYVGYGDSTEIDREITSSENFVANKILDNGLTMKYIKEKRRMNADSLTNDNENNNQYDELCLQNSGELTGLNLKEARTTAVEYLIRNNLGGLPASPALKDWLISRQRYWGAPIPMINCPSCGAVPVPSDELPVQLPTLGQNDLLNMKEIGPRALSLSKREDWKNTLCPKCGNSAERETDTMDTFVDSSWYFLRFLDPLNCKKPFDKNLIDSGMPVDLYIGGEEHAVLHLYFARFFQHFLYSQNLTKHREPFNRLLLIGRIKSPTYIREKDNKYLRKEEVDFTSKPCKEIATGYSVKIVSEKMSKSKYNGVNPTEVIAKHSTDIIRLTMLRGQSAITNRIWEEESIGPVVKWVNTIWRTVGTFVHVRENGTNKTATKEEILEACETLREARNTATYWVNYNFDKTLLINLAIHELETFNHIIRSVPLACIREAEYEKSLATLLIMLSAMMPHISAELWTAFSKHVALPIYTAESDIHKQSWPQVDSDHQEKVKVIVNVDDDEIMTNKILPDSVDFSTDDKIEKFLNNNPNVQQVISNKNIVKSNLQISPNGFSYVLNIYTLDKKELTAKRKLQKELKKQKILAAKKK